MSKCNLCGGEASHVVDAYTEGGSVCRPCVLKAIALLKRVEAGESVEFPISIMAKVKAEYGENLAMTAEEGIAAVWCECKLLAKSPVGPLFDGASKGNSADPAETAARIQAGADKAMREMDKPCSAALRDGGRDGHE